MKTKNWLLLIGCILLVGAGAIRAQSITPATPAVIQVTGLLANCPVASTSVFQYCFTTTGEYQSLGTTSWVLVGAAATAGVTSISFNNGPAKTGAVVYTISATAPAISAN